MGSDTLCVRQDGASRGGSWGESMTEVRIPTECVASWCFEGTGDGGRKGNFAEAQYVGLLPEHSYHAGVRHLCSEGRRYWMPRGGNDVVAVEV